MAFNSGIKCKMNHIFLALEVEMRRIIDERLSCWAASSSRKPLLLFGARQVGKTYALKELGKSRFENFVHLDFSKNSSAASIFENSLDPARIVTAIEAYLRTPINPERTLLIFDEIQLCERALTSLKYFCEDAPQYAVAGAGSLLGVKLREKGSFPVGKVETALMHPFSFEEFLWARGETRMGSLIENCTQTMETFPLHEEALDLYRQYLLVGGMPDVVKNFVKHVRTDAINAYEEARNKQIEIDQAYIADIAKHAPSNLVPKILDVWRSVPSQLTKENSKFQYKAVKSGGRASMFEEPMAWLVAAAVLSKCVRVSEPVAPLGSFEDPSSFKLYRADTGLMAASLQALPSDALPQEGKASAFRGALAESYVMQQLSSADVRPYYWGVPSKQEVDFIVRSKQGDVIPVEVKSGSNVRSNSLEAYRRKYNPPYVARFSDKNFGEDKFVRSIPLYAACYFARDLVSSPLFT